MTGRVCVLEHTHIYVFYTYQIMNKWIYLERNRVNYINCKEIKLTVYRPKNVTSYFYYGKFVI